MNVSTYSLQYLKEISLKGKSEKEIRELIIEHNNQLMFIKDAHCGEGYTAGVIEIDKKDSECYKINTSKEKKRLHFHDLEGLLKPDISFAT